MKLLTRCRTRLLVVSITSILVCGGSIARCGTVTSAADDGTPGTLRSQVITTPDHGFIDINLPAGSVISLIQGQILLQKNLTIGDPTLSHITITDPSNDRVFEIRPLNNVGFTLTLVGLRFTGGFMGSPGNNGTSGDRPGKQPAAAATGGIILNGADCSLIVSDCIFDQCHVIGGTGGLGYGGDVAPPGDGGAGGDAQGGAISTLGMLVVSDSTFIGNWARGGRGGDGTNALTSFNGSKGGKGGRGFGGAIYVDYNGAPALLATNCTLYGNTAYGGDGGKGGDAPSAPAAGNGGDGYDAYGGAVCFANANCIFPDCGLMDHSTVNQNHVRGGTGGPGGIGPISGMQGTDGVGYGGGLYLATMSYEVWNNIIAGNGGLGAGVCVGPDVKGTVVSLDHNLVGVVDGNTGGWTPLDLQGGGIPLDPLLGPLQNNGGFTPTMAPLPGSPAIDSGSAGDALFDQIGQPRPIPVTTGPFSSDGSDIGAFEVQCSTDIPVLKIVQASGELIITWPWPTYCFRLQQSTDLITWTDSTYAINVSGNQNQVVLPPPVGNLFFRLKK